MFGARRQIQRRIAELKIATAPGDNVMINRLFTRFCRNATKLPTLKHGQSMPQAIAAAHPDGYEAVIPDGLGGTRTIIVIAMVK